jgi:hypothetical protein
MKYELEMLRLNTGRQTQISTVATRLVNHLFRYGVSSLYLYTELLFTFFGRVLFTNF